jgi:hypothetical protein
MCHMVLLKDSVDNNCTVAAVVAVVAAVERVIVQVIVQVPVRVFAGEVVASAVLVACFVQMLVTQELFCCNLAT